MCFLAISASSPSSSARRLKSLSLIFGRWDEPRSGFPLLRERRMERSSSFPFRYFAVKAVWTGGNDIDFYHVADPGTLRLHMDRSEEHTSELQSLMRISYAVFCLKKKKR